MEQVKKYRPSLLAIGALLFGGFLFIAIYLMVLIYSPWDGLGSFLMLSLLIAFFTAICIGWALHLWKKRKEGVGFYWDDEGVVIDLKGHKVYWNEIENIKFVDKGNSFSHSTVIYPHYTHHEKIRIRRNKWMPTPAHSIEWFLMEKPEEYHDHVIKIWKEKCKMK